MIRTGVRKRRGRYNGCRKLFIGVFQQRGRKLKELECRKEFLQPRDIFLDDAEKKEGNKSSTALEWAGVNELSIKAELLTGRGAQYMRSMQHRGCTGSGSM